MRLNSTGSRRLFVKELQINRSMAPGRGRRSREFAEKLRGEPRVAIRPEIDDGAARARRTRDLGAICAQLRDPAGKRADATQDERSRIV
jgi:hypothetical protein